MSCCSFQCLESRTIVYNIAYDEDNTMDFFRRSRFALLMLGILDLCNSFHIDKRLKLADILPEDLNSYDRLFPPVVPRGTNDSLAYDPAIVRFRIHVMGVDSINEVSMTFTADVYLGQKWKDHRLSLPNITQKFIALDLNWLKEIWHPTSFFRNAKDIQFQSKPVPNHYLLLHPDKYILYSMKLSLKLSCAMNFALYPHDTQECRLQMNSLCHPTKDVLFEWDNKVRNVQVDEKVHLPQLAVTEAYRADCVQDNVNYSCLDVVFILKRNMGYYLINTYIPTCLIVIMSWISFWIKPDAVPARISLGVTSLLTLLTQHSKSQESLPRVSYLKMVDAFMLTSTVYVFMVLIEFCLVTILLDEMKPAATEANSSSPAENCKTSFFIDNKLTYMNSNELHWPLILSNGNIPTKTDDELHQCVPRLDRISRILFPLSFIILNCVYWLTAFYPADSFIK